jgi:hypothetical protein
MLQDIEGHPFGLFSNDMKYTGGIRSWVFLTKTANFSRPSTATRSTTFSAGGLPNCLPAA